MIEKSISLLNKKFNRLFIKYFFPYLIIIIIFIIVSTYSYNISFNEIENNIVKNQRNLIQQSKTYLDNVFQYIQDSISIFLSNSIVVNFASVDQSKLKSNYFSTVVLLNEMKGIVIDYSYINNYYIIYRNSQQVIINGRSLIDYKLFYKYQFTYNDYTKEEFYKLIFKGPYFGGKYFPATKTTHLEKNKSTKSILMVQTIAFDSKGSSAVIVYDIDYNQIEKYMAKDASMESQFFIFDQDGIEIAQFTNNENHSNNKDYIINVLDSDTSDLKYQLKADKASAYKRLNEIKVLNNWLYIALFLTNFIISYYFAKKYSRPVLQLVHENGELSTKVLEQKIAFRQSFLEKWLNGNFNDQDEAENMARCINISYIGGCYCVVVIDIDPNNWLIKDKQLTKQEEVTVNENLKDLLAPIFHKDFICDITKSRVAVIFVSKESIGFNNGKEILAKIKLCKDCLDEKGLIRSIYTVGSIENNIIQVSRSFSTAKDTLNRAINNLDSIERIYCYDNNSHTDGLYYYPCELESRLINCVQVGNTDEVRKIIKEIYQENILKKNLSSDMIGALLYELCGTFIKVKEKIGDNESEHNDNVNLIKKISSLDLLNQLQYIQKSFLDLSDKVEGEKKDTYSKLMYDMKDYIKSNYQHSYLGLSSLATEFGFTEVYISQMFKNFFDTSFINYLQDLRMDKIRELLVTTELPVKDIMIKVGYNSMNTFTRAFKRVNGITATEYRKRSKETLQI